MADADRKPVVSIDPQYLLTAEVVERAPAERSKHDTIDTILDWLADPVRHMPRWSAGSTNSHGASGGRISAVADDSPCSHAASAIPRCQLCLVAHHRSNCSNSRCP